MKELYFKNANLSLYYNKRLRLGEAVWNGELFGEEFREATLLSLDLIDRFQLQRWLGDNRKMKPIQPADLKWCMEVFLPQLLEGPLLRMANLPSEYEETRKAIEVMVDKVHVAGQQLIMRDFYDRSEAMEWLLE